MASALGLTEDRVNIKATPEEGLGFTGSGEGISAQAVCLLQPLMDVVADSRMYADTGCPGCGGCARSGGEAKNTVKHRSEPTSILPDSER